jgi:hypothetical protein
MININGLDIMDTLISVYLLNILCPYYKFIQTILLYLLKLLQMKYNIIYIIVYYILIMCNKKLIFNIIYD